MKSSITSRRKKMANKNSSMSKTRARDRTEKIADLTVQHGKVSDRVYLMKMGDAEPVECMKTIESLARENNYSKIFAKVPGTHGAAFEKKGYVREAEIPGFYDGREAGVFLGKYLDKKRAKPDDEEKLEEVLETALERRGMGIKKPLEPGFAMRRCAPDDAKKMARLYSKVFESYPFPIDDPKYILKTMESHVIYYCVEFEGDLVALSSAELDSTAGNAEMTDFATDPDWAGRSFASHLLRYMDEQVADLGIYTSYTIARAASHGMNITFSRMGYSYGGRLVNNTGISGGVESMNVWYKSLVKPEDED